MFGFFSLNISGDCRLTMWRPHGFNGQIEGWTHNGFVRGKGFALNDTCHTGARALIVPNSLIIPCSMDAIQRVQSFMDMQTLMATPLGDSRAPYYFAMMMNKNTDFEKTTTARHFGGLQTAYKGAMKKNDRGEIRRLRRYESPFEERSNLQRFFTHVASYLPWGHDDDSHITRDIPDDHIEHARYNCWTAWQSTIQYVAGIDLGLIDPRLPYFYRARHACEWADTIGKLPEKREPTTQVADNFFAFNLHRNNPAFFVREEMDLRAFLNQQVPPVQNDDIPPKMSEYLHQVHKSGALSSPSDVSTHLHASGASKAPKLKP